MCGRGIDRSMSNTLTGKGLDNFRAPHYRAPRQRKPVPVREGELMDVYRIVLFLHLCALLAAIATAAIVHYAEHRMLSAVSVATTREWAALVARAERVFPVAILTLVATGAYMVQRAWSWSDGWVDAGIA